MIKSLVLLATLAVLVAAIGLSTAGAAGPAAGVATTTAATTTSTAPAVSDAELGSLAELAQYVKATQGQRVQLKAKARENSKAAQDFMAVNGAGWQQAMAESTDAQNDADKRETAGKKVAQFQAQWEQLLAARQGAAMSVLTPDQRLAWEEHSLIDAMTARVAGMTIRHDASGQLVAQKGELTPRQTKVIEDECKSMAKTILSGDNPYDPKRRQDLVTKLEADIHQKIQPAGITLPTQPGPAQLEEK